MRIFAFSYSVIVEYMDNRTCSDSPSIDWTTMSTISRINERSAKDVIVCYIIKSENLSDEELDKPCCIEKFTVKEVIVRRWLSEKARENVTKGNSIEISSSIESD